MKSYTQSGLDKEWIRLVSEAKELGLSVEDVRKFLQYSSSRQAN